MSMYEILPILGEEILPSVLKKRVVILHIDMLTINRKDIFCSVNGTD